MRIGINASFLRKPGTGIGQVSVHFIQKLAASTQSTQTTTFFLYTEEPIDLKLPENFTVRTFLPRFWKRDDLIRKVLWEQQVAREAEKDNCDAFISLYQSATNFHTSSVKRHTMVVHDIIPELFPEYQGNLRKRLYWRAVTRGIERAPQILAVSQSTKHDLVEFGIPEERITVAYPSVAPHFYLPADEAGDLQVLATYSLEPGYIYHGGGLEVRKNAEGLLRAYREVRDSEPTIPKLVISGRIFSETNPLATPVRRLVQELHLEEQVQLLDFVPEHDLPALYRQALFFAYPSHYEGLGLPLVEAMTLGVPILTADNSSLMEVAGDGALYVDSHRREAIASGLKTLIADASLRERLGHEGRERAKLFEWQSFVETLIALATKTS